MAQKWTARFLDGGMMEDLPFIAILVLFAAGFALGYAAVLLLNAIFLGGKW